MFCSILSDCCCVLVFHNSSQKLETNGKICDKRLIILLPTSFLPSFLPKKLLHHCQLYMNPKRTRISKGLNKVAVLSPNRQIPFLSRAGGSSLFGLADGAKHKGWLLALVYINQCFVCVCACVHAHIKAGSLRIPLFCCLSTAFCFQWFTRNYSLILNYSLWGLLATLRFRG